MSDQQNSDFLAAITRAETNHSSLMKRLKIVQGLSIRQWIEVLIAIGALFYARMQFARLTTKELICLLSGSLGQDGGVETFDAPLRNSKRKEELKRLDVSIRVAAAIVPWRSDCLLRCIAAHRLLRRRGFTPEFYLGVNKPSATTLAAHAWTMCHGVPIAGGSGEGFEVLIGPDENPKVLRKSS